MNDNRHAPPPFVMSDSFIAVKRLELCLTAAGVVLLAALATSAVHAYDLLTWVMEVAPVLLALPLLAGTFRKHPLTPLLYSLIFVHCVVLIVGGTYTYARVPIGFAVQDWLQLSRNPYDKLGHFAQGFVPAILAREILIQGKHIQGRKMLVYVILCIVLSFSAFYELIEWAAALVMGQGADEFLGTQGDQWDTQSDMFFAMVGAICALVMLSRWHDRQLRRLRRPD